MQFLKCLYSYLPSSLQFHSSGQKHKDYSTSTQCEGVGGVQGALTLFRGGEAQAFHDDRAVELKEQLVVEEVDGARQERKVKEAERSRIKENAP